MLPVFAILSAVVLQSSAFYLPGVAPSDYKTGDRVPLDVNALSSNDTVLPYDYYYKQFGFCKPENLVKRTESLGAILFGDRLMSSPFELSMNKAESCKILCKDVIVSGEQAKFINKRILQHYQFNWVVDGLPAARLMFDPHTHRVFNNPGFELGRIDYSRSKAFLNNHYHIEVNYTTTNDKDFRVVGVIVYPMSVKALNKDCTFPDTMPPLMLSETQDNTVFYSYSVTWTRGSVSWATRWDNYLYTGDAKIHWFSLVNSSVIVLFLSVMVAMILLRALHKDIARYNSLEAQEDAQEEFGWKLVHGDVFRPPVCNSLFAVLVGSGAQMCCMCCVTLVFALLGFLSPSSRGALTTVMLVFWVFFAGVAGFTSARMYKMFGGEGWKKNIVMTALVIPGIIFAIFTILNFFLVGADSSAAVPAGTFFVLIAMWFLVSAPLCFVGAYYGFKKPRIENPVRTNQIPRQIPDQPFYLTLFPSMLMGGILPFGAIFIELFYMMNSLWYHQFYYLFGFLFLVSSVLVITCSEVTILMCYFQLCAEDYRWWWRSFLTSGASAIYVFGYSILYYYTRLQIDDFASAVLYFGWSAVLSIMFFIVTGFIGFAACYIFVRKIYSSIKID